MRRYLANSPTPMEDIMRKSIPVYGAAGFAVAAASVAFAGSEFEGTWKVTDNAGKPYEITIAPDGTASGTQESGQKGRWKADGNGVVIEWNTGWTTRIAKDGSAFTKTAAKVGEEAKGAPTPAVKVK